MKRFAILSLSCVCAIALYSSLSRADEPAAPTMTPPAATEPKTEQKGTVIKPEEAKDNVGKDVIVEFTVAAGRELEDKGIAFLNSSNDPNDPAGFTAFITKTGMTKLKGDGKIEHPVDHFNQKKVRVSGKVKMYKEKAEIEITNPNQITIIEEEAGKAM